MSGTASPILDQMRDQADKLFRGGRFAEAASAYRGILEVVPGDFAAIHRMGQVAIQLGHMDEARRLLQAAIQIDSSHAEAWLHHGMALQHLRRTDEAVESYQRALGLKENYLEALFCLAVTQKDAGRARDALHSFNLFLGLSGDHPIAFLQRGILLHQGGRYSEALADYESALTLQPDYLDAWIHRGVLFSEQGRADDALASFDKAVLLAPERGNVWFSRGLALQDLGRDPEALDAYEQAVKFAPDFPDAWNNRGVMLRKAGRQQDALASYERALSLDPKLVQALNNRGAILIDLHRFDEALACYDQALAASPRHAEGWYNRGIALHHTGQNAEALAAYDQAVALAPNSTDAWNNRGNILREVGRLDEAMDSFQRALALDPHHAETLANAGGGLQDLKRFAEAERQYRRLETVAPDHKYLVGGLALSAAMLCDWQVLQDLMPRLEAEVMSGKTIVPPFTLLGLSSDPALHRIGARHYYCDSSAPPPPAARPMLAAHDKIHLAYVSNDFHTHATGRLMADLFERHDRSRFEVIAISYGPDKKSAMHERLKRAFDQFHDVRALSDRDAAALMKSLAVDIAIDLKGYTEKSRLGIFALRPAPLQVSYLGYPGTIGMDFMDYVIADPVVLPFDQQDFYSEQIVQLPDSYQANDPQRSVGTVPTRAEAGLSAQGFVFNCFNNHWKIAAPVFDVWMRLLQAVPGSVLWLLDDSANDGLRRQAQARGVDPQRLIFAPKLEHDAHMGRLALADLLLDTLPYNAHTTASDALWVGVPLVTVRDRTFAGRVGASLLTATGLPDLIADDLAGYEALALSLAKNPAKLRAIKDKLAKNRPLAPLFDAPRFAAHIEAAYIAMMERARRGEPPKAFAISAQS